MYINHALRVCLTTNAVHPIFVFSMYVFGQSEPTAKSRLLGDNGKLACCFHRRNGPWPSSSIERETFRSPA